MDLRAGNKLRESCGELIYVDSYLLILAFAMWMEEAGTAERSYSLGTNPVYLSSLQLLPFEVQLSLSDQGGPEEKGAGKPHLPNPAKYSSS